MSGLCLLKSGTGLCDRSTLQRVIFESVCQFKQEQQQQEEVGGTPLWLRVYGRLVRSNFSPFTDTSHFDDVTDEALRDLYEKNYFVDPLQWQHMVRLETMLEIEVVLYLVVGWGGEDEGEDDEDWIAETRVLYDGRMVRTFKSRDGNWRLSQQQQQQKPQVLLLTVLQPQCEIGEYQLLRCETDTCRTSWHLGCLEGAFLLPLCEQCISLRVTGEYVSLYSCVSRLTGVKFASFPPSTLSVIEVLCRGGGASWRPLSERVRLILVTYCRDSLPVARKKRTRNERRTRTKADWLEDCCFVLEDFVLDPERGLEFLHGIRDPVSKREEEDAVDITFILETSLDGRVSLLWRSSDSPTAEDAAVWSWVKKTFPQEAVGWLQSVPYHHGEDDDLQHRWGGEIQGEKRRQRTSRCECDVCLEADEVYAKNMKERTPGGRSQFPLRFEPSVEDYLRMFGVSDCPVERSVYSDESTWLCLCREASRLSLASVDLESLTVPVGTTRLPQGVFRAAAGSDSSSGDRYRASQRIALIGYTDSGQQSVSFWDLRDHRNNSSTMVDDFLRHLETRRSSLAGHKSGLLRPIREWIDTYKRRHYVFHQRREGGLPTEETGGDEQDAAELEAKRTWSGTLLGRFEERLENLTQTLCVFSFHGAGYDHVLLCPKVIRSYYVNKKRKKKKRKNEEEKKAAREQRTNARPRVLKRGRDVLRMTLAGGRVTFVDAKLMLGPGTSLASLARQCSLSMAKGIFPFCRLTSMSYLDETRLPVSASEWNENSLGGKTVDQAEVDEALATFDRLGCANVGEYMRHYLRLDVEILQSCLRHLYDMMLQSHGIDFVERRAFTAASMSMHSSQTFLARQRRVSMTAMADPTLFSVRQTGVRFGLGSCHQTLSHRCSDTPRSAPSPARTERWREMCPRT